LHLGGANSAAGDERGVSEHRDRTGGEQRVASLILPAAVPVADVVVCEDDAPTLELLCDHLAADRYRPYPAACAADALRLCHFKQPDLLLLDLLLPDAGGLDVLREIRGSDGVTGRYDPGLPVIVLSGRATPSDRVRGLSAGADDYVTKPFHYEELAGRVAAVLRRRDEHRAGPIRVGDLVVDSSRREATVAGRPVRLANKEFALLRVLAAEPTRVFTKQELLRDIWGYRAVGRTRTLDSHASRLRRKLDPEHARYVVNVWGYGYRLIDAPGNPDGRAA
jgi:DNA-binding response OmpR family regulator